ncbi:MAG: hypothetical protein LUC25_01100 [Ruminococcus sp.]|nr:hypothetical protein [Ruminococcus sp.]
MLIASMEILIVALAMIITYSVFATMWIFKPKWVISIADKFGIKIKDPRTEIAPIYVEDDEEPEPEEEPKKERKSIYETVYCYYNK